MKLFGSIVVHLLLAAGMGVGIVLLATAGKPALLLISVAVYLGLLGRIGCAAH